MTTAGDQERIAKLRELIEAEGGPAPSAPGASAPRSGDGPPANRTPLLIAVGAGVGIAVVVAVLIALGSGGGVEQPDDTTERAVPVFPSRIAGGKLDKGDKVTICDRKEGTLAEDLTVANYGTQDSPLFGSVGRLDVYIPNELVGRFANKAPADLDVVRGRCGALPTTTTSTTTTTAPPATQPPADPTQPTQPPDSTRS